MGFDAVARFRLALADPFARRTRSRPMRMDSLGSHSNHGDHGDRRERGPGRSCRRRELARGQGSDSVADTASGTDYRTDATAGTATGTGTTAAQPLSQAPTTPAPPAAQPPGAGRPAAGAQPGQARERTSAEAAAQQIQIDRDGLITMHTNELDVRTLLELDQPARRDEYPHFTERQREYHGEL